MKRNHNLSNMKKKIKILKKNYKNLWRKIKNQEQCGKLNMIRFFLFKLNIMYITKKECNLMKEKIKELERTIKTLES